ncbi:tRNA 2-thiouridine(34) synthase MnmA [Isosphaeraceae bacterium EP7]
MPSRVVVAMSGGVDSSVAAALLKQAGHEVIGLFMRTGDHGDAPERKAKTCCSLTDALDARSVADRLDIPFYTLDFEGEFKRIIDQFADEYAEGRTPNPCVLCNIWLKFGKLWSYGKQVGADYVATGHYARIVRDAAGLPRVARALDPSKDQSYVLFGLRPELLNNVLLPVGGFDKAEIREMARTMGLPVHDKPDSQDICFVPDDDYLSLIRARRPDLGVAGPMIDEDGTDLGQHSGIEAFTIGQRRGLGLSVGSPRYVVQIEPLTHKVVVGRRESLDRPGLDASKFNWHVPAPTGTLPCMAQIRAKHKAVRALAVGLPDGHVAVRFETPQRAVTPGQVVTLYDDEGLVLGGGWIDRDLDETSLDRLFDGSTVDHPLAVP